MIGVGLLLMRGLDAGSSSWTHLIPGLILSGIGAGLVNPPLASTAVGVVEPARAGMASGINSTFRQVGIATGIALLGTLFASRVGDSVLTGVQQVPGLAGQGEKFAGAVQSGKVEPLLMSLPDNLRGAAGELTRTAFTDGLNRILLLAGIVALVSAVLTFFLIRQKDFVSQGGPAGGH